MLIVILYLSHNIPSYHNKTLPATVITFPNWFIYLWVLFALGSSSSLDEMNIFLPFERYRACGRGFSFSHFIYIIFVSQPTFGGQIIVLYPSSTSLYIAINVCLCLCVLLASCVPPCVLYATHQVCLLIWEHAQVTNRERKRECLFIRTTQRTRSTPLAGRLLVMVECIVVVNVERKGR